MKGFECKGSDAIVVCWNGQDIAPLVVLPDVGRDLQKVLSFWHASLGGEANPFVQATILVLAAYQVRGAEASMAKIWNIPARMSTGVTLNEIQSLGQNCNGCGVLMLNTGADELQASGGYALNTEEVFNLWPVRKMALSFALKAPQIVWPGDPEKKGKAGKKK